MEEKLDFYFEIVSLVRRKKNCVKGNLYFLGYTGDRVSELNKLINITSVPVSRFENLCVGGSILARANTYSKHAAGMYRTLSFVLFWPACVLSIFNSIDLPRQPCQQGNPTLESNGGDLV